MMYDIFEDKLDNAEYDPVMSFNNLSNYSIDNSYKLDENYLDNCCKLDKSNIENMDNYEKYNTGKSAPKFDDIDKYKMKVRYSGYKVEHFDNVECYKNDSINKHSDENEETNYEVVNSNSSTNTGFSSTSKPNIQIMSYNLDDKNKKMNEKNMSTGFENMADNREFLNYYQPYQFYGNYQNCMMNQIPNYPMTTHNYNPLNINIEGLNNSNINNINLEPILRENSTIDNESIEDIDNTDQMPINGDINLNKNMHDSINGRVVNSIDINDNEVDIRPPLNRSDPIYTSISGLKWKSKSKKWVVRWDNPITNRRVYKYFSGNRYGFLGAHKRAKFYLEFLNASVGKINSTTPGNPFCRRTEGPPKGKTNKSLIRKYYTNSYIQYPDYINGNYIMNGNHNQMTNYVANNGENSEVTNVDGANNTSNLEYYNYFYNQDKTNNMEAGSSMDNPWYITQNFNNF